MVSENHSHFFGKLFYLFVRYLYLTFRSVITLPYGYFIFKVTGKTPLIAHKSMIWLFCVTQGRFSDWISLKISKKNPPIKLLDNTGVLGDMSDANHLSVVVSQLEKNGFVVFPSQLPLEMVDRLTEFAKKTPALVRRMDCQDTSLHVGKTIYTGGIPTAVRYDYDTADLLNNEVVQTLLADPSLLRVVQAYLNCQPVADVLSMWWHTNFSDVPDSEAGQYFHFDMDRFKWLKIFIYLTDVGFDNGPHAFVEGSHTTGSIPKNILKRGYVRVMDDEIISTYGAKRIHSFTAPKGSIIIEDTRGFHKGVHVTGDPRLILQLQFSNSLFGTNYKRARMEQISSPAMKKILKLAPSIYRQYS